MSMQQKNGKWQPAFEAAEHILKKQNRGAVSDRVETSRRTANGIDNGDIYYGT
jgi:hypothetical protein